MRQSIYVYSTVATTSMLHQHRIFNHHHRSLRIPHDISWKEVRWVSKLSLNFSTASLNSVQQLLPDVACYDAGMINCTVCSTNVDIIFFTTMPYILCASSKFGLSFLFLWLSHIFIAIVHFRCRKMKWCRQKWGCRNAWTMRKEMCVCLPCDWHFWSPSREQNLAHKHTRAGIFCWENKKHDRYVRSKQKKKGWWRKNMKQKKINLNIDSIQ